jgi:enoyl-CoA hydratase
VSSGEILIERQGGLGIVTLNRPQTLNTLSLDMYRRFDPALAAWAGEPRVRAVLVRGAGGRAFCAGGDVVAIYQARAERGGDGYKADFFREEYRLVQRVHRFPKPYVALLNGVTMGGGAGIAVNGSFRIATDATVFAMPEVQIGLFPDVAATRFLNLCPGRIGLYLALTGKRIGAADALYCGLATHFVPHDGLDELTASLAALDGQADAAAQIAGEIARFAADPGAATLPPLQPEIDRVFAGDCVEAIAAALEREPGAWAQAARAAMATASPLSLKITFRQLRHGVMPVEAALRLEYRLTQHIMDGHDFFEGIRALLIDKDRKPRWQHASLEAVREAEVAGYFEPIGARELTFEP